MLKQIFKIKFLFFVLLGQGCVIPLAFSKEVYNIAFMHQNLAGEGGWTLSHEIAREKLDAYYGDKITTTSIDGVNPGADAERVLTQYARNKKDLIIATSFGFLSATKKVANRFKNVKFEHATGYYVAKNLGTFQLRAYQGRYMAGYIAGSVTKTHKIGYVGSFPIPEVLRGINAFTLGVKAANPAAEVELIWVNSWNDPAKEKEATQLLIAKGVDIVTHHTETSTVVQTAAKAKVYSIGYQSNRQHAAPNYHLVSIEHNWFPIYKKRIDALMSGQWQADRIWDGVELDVTRLVGIGDSVPKDVLAKVNEIKESMIKGDLHVFQGPIVDQNGFERVKLGAVLDDEQLLALEWLSQGVNGSLGAK